MNFFTIFTMVALVVSAQPSRLSRSKRDLTGWNRATNSLPHMNQHASRLPKSGNANIGAIMRHSGVTDRQKAKALLKAIQRIRRARSAR